MVPPTLVREHELGDTVTRVAFNGDQKTVLLLALVEGHEVITIIDATGAIKTRLEGHKAPVIAACWLGPDVAGSMDAGGEIRTWVMRGSKIECTRFKDTVPGPAGLAAWPATRRPVTRLAAWTGDGTLYLVENGAVKSKTRLGETILDVVPASGDSVHVLASTGDGITVHEVTPDGSATVAGTITDPRVAGARSGTVAGHPAGFALHVDGTLLGFPAGGGKVHPLPLDAPATAVAVDPATRTVIAGTKLGQAVSWGYRENGSFVDKVRAFTLHDFSITAMAIEPGRALLACGSLDGLVKLFTLPAGSLQAARHEPAAAGPSWREQERAANKISQARAYAVKGDVRKAREVLAEVKAMHVPGTDTEITTIEAGLLSGEEARARGTALKEKVITFLQKTSRDRGDILLDEIVTATGIAKPDLKRVIKETSSSMAWEYVDQHECLFLFERVPQITRDVHLPPARVEQGRSAPRGRPGRRDQPRPREQPQHRQPRRDTGPLMSTDKNVAFLAGQVDRVDGSMKAFLFNAQRREIDAVPLPQLASYLDDPATRAKKVAYILSDGIVSPRLFTQASALGVSIVAGKRLHPNLDVGATGPGTRCMELDQIASNADLANEAPSGGDLEDAIIGALHGNTWTSEMDILAALALPGEIEAGLARVKLKQLVAAGKAEKLVEGGKMYYRLDRN